MARESLLTKGKPIKFVSAETAGHLTNVLKEVADGQPPRTQGFFADLIKSGQLQVDHYVATSLGPKNLLDLAHEYQNEPLALALLDNEAFVREFDTQIRFWPAIWSIPVLERILEIKGSVAHALATDKFLNKSVVDYADERSLRWFVEHGMSLDSAVDGNQVYVPVHRFASRSDATRFDLLLRAGADPYTTDVAGNGYLHIAVDGGMKPSDKFRDSPERAEQFRRFLAVCNDHALDLNRQNIHGMTTLHLAARLGYTNMTVELIRAGADPQLTDNRNKTPLDLAKASRRRETAAVFAAVRAREAILETVRRAGVGRGHTGPTKE